MTKAEWKKMAAELDVDPADAAYELAVGVLVFDEENPGDEGSTVEVPAQVWSRLVKLACLAKSLR